MGKEEPTPNVERRKFFRIDLPMPVSASMKIKSVDGKEVELKKTKVLIENLGLGGLRFLSNIKFPIQREILLQCKTELLGETVEINGKIVWMLGLKGQVYQYGLRFTIDEKERSELAKLLNRLDILVKKKSNIPGCNFVDVSPYTFFKAGK